MKETKKFYTSDRLNRGYKAEPIELEQSSNNETHRKYENLLPPVDVISAYEEIHPGTLGRLIAMAEKEQEHRQMQDKANLAIFETSRRMGAFFGCLTALAICFVTLKLTAIDINKAISFAVIGFAGIFGVSFMAYSRSYVSHNKTTEQRERFRKPYYNNQHNRRNNK